jgi:DNA-directed RNA polymerase specialized sigma24 family protein
MEMTKEEKELINELKSKGLGYKAISKELNIPLGTVKTVIRRGKEQCSASLITLKKLHE